MDTVVLDTNVILRFLLADNEELHGRAEQILNDVKSGAKLALMSEAVIAECVFVLRSFYDIPRSLVADDLLGILQLKGAVGPQLQILIDAFHLYGDQNISFVDSVALITARKAGVSLATFDQKLAKIAAKFDESTP